MIKFESQYRTQNSKDWYRLAIHDTEDDAIKKTMLLVESKPTTSYRVVEYKQVVVAIHEFRPKGDE